MAPRNAKPRAVLLVTLFTFLLFQGTEGSVPGSKAYLTCIRSCLKKYPAFEYRFCCAEGCRREATFNFKCKATGPDMGVSLAGGGDLGKVGDDGFSTPSLDDLSALSPAFYCCYGRCFYLCEGGKITPDATSCHNKCVNKVCTISKLDAYDDLASHEAVAAGGGNLGKGNNGTETGGAAP